PHSEIIALPLKIKKAGHNKLIIDVAWDGVNVKEDEPVIKRLKCFSKAVTVKDPVQKGTFGERKAQFELIVHRNNAHVKCRQGTVDGDSFIRFFTFQT
ncbi:33717_t:CDS:2, partial [Gigaspora margarita]